MSGLFVSPGKAATPFIGVAKPFIFPAPLPGVEVDIVLPGGAFYRVINWYQLFTTSVAVANRTPRFRITDATTRLWSLGIPANVAASTAVEINLASNLPLSASLSIALTGTLPFPDVVIPGGFHLLTNTLNIDVGDQYGAPVLWMEELDQGPMGNQYGLVPFGATAIGPNGEG